MPDFANIEKTHKFVGYVDEQNKDKVFSMMQGEVWSPEGQARGLAQRVGHTSMMTGDLVCVNNRFVMVDPHGWFDLYDRKKVASVTPQQRTAAPANLTLDLKIELAYQGFVDDVRWCVSQALIKDKFVELGMPVVSGSTPNYKIKFLSGSRRSEVEVQLVFKPDQEKLLVAVAERTFELHFSRAAPLWVSAKIITGLKEYGVV